MKEVIGRLTTEAQAAETTTANLHTKMRFLSDQMIEIEREIKRSMALATEIRAAISILQMNDAKANKPGSN